MIITSYNNSKLKTVRDLMEKARERKKAGAFVIEGIRMFSETPKELLKDVYVSESFHEEHGDIEATVLSDQLFKRLSDTKSPQGILAVVKQPLHDYKSILEGNRGLFLILENIQDPGNLGTMLRTGEAAGVSLVVMDRGTADVFSPKVVRSTMGAVYRVPFIYCDDLITFVKGMQEKGIKVYAADLKGDRYYHEEKYAEKSAFLIGNEGNGLSREMLDLSDIRVKIPMKGKTESLNAAVAAALLMYGYATDTEV